VHARSASVIKIVSRGRKAHLVLKVGDEDDGDDLARQCPIPFFVYLLPFLCSLGPLILSPILFYFFLVPSLSIFFFFSLFFHPAFFSSILSLFLRLCISFAWEVNSARWIHSRGTWTIPAEFHFGTVHIVTPDIATTLKIIMIMKKKQISSILFF